MRKTILSFLSLILLLNIVSVSGQEAEATPFVAFGASLDEGQMAEILENFAATDIPEENQVTIDGTILDKYLGDGSDENTTVYSSAYVEFLPEGSGITVEIVTPDLIVKVPQKTYENAAIAAGAKDALIKIAAPQSVTGEGALAGVYEIFEVAGEGLDALAITNAENQIKIEQLLIEETDLNEDEVSELIGKINLEIINSYEANGDLDEDTVNKIVLDILDEGNYDLEEGIVESISQHALSFSQSPVAKDPETKKALEASLGGNTGGNNQGNTFQSGSLNADIIGESFKFKDTEFVFNDIYFTDDRDSGADPYDNVIRFDYDVTYTGNEDYVAGFEVFVKVNGEKARQYYLKDDRNEKIGPNETYNALASYAFNGEAEEIEIEIKDLVNYDDSIIITLTPKGSNNNQPTETEENETEEEQSENSNTNNGNSLNKKYTIGDVDVTINEIYLTDERNDNEIDVDNVLSIDYDLTYNGKEDYKAGFEFKLKVDGKTSEYYNLPSDKNASLKPGQTENIIASFGFDGDPKNIELELRDLDKYQEDSIFIKLSNLPK